MYILLPVLVGNMVGIALVCSIFPRLWLGKILVDTRAIPTNIAH